MLFLKAWNGSHTHVLRPLLSSPHLISRKYASLSHLMRELEADDKKVDRIAYVEYKSKSAEFRVKNNSTINELLKDSQQFWNINPKAHSWLQDGSGRELAPSKTFEDFTGRIQLSIQTHEEPTVEEEQVATGFNGGSTNTHFGYEHGINAVSQVFDKYMNKLLASPKCFSVIRRCGFDAPTQEQQALILLEFKEHLQYEHEKLTRRLSTDARLHGNYSQKNEDRLTDVFLNFLSSGESKLKAVYSGHLELANLRKPWLWYQQARSMERRIVIHTGPTNSGKTHHALERLAASKSGVYCGPLRLLAHEIHERLNNRGVKCSLLTGQTKLDVEGATHVACTVEMVSTAAPVDVAVLDEFQMLGDEERGWAWTRALLGVPAKEIHVCGDGTAVDIVQRIGSMIGEQVDVHNYNRLSPLKCMNNGLRNKYQSVRPGDCVVAFTRADIYAIKEAIERSTSHKCCVVYGSLPPSTRSQQAALFNQPDSGFDVLVASDAIGMGLNLNIRRVVFSTVRKFDGTEKRQLTDSEIKQIAGRAGRFGSIYPEGEVSCFLDTDIPIIQRALQSPLDEHQQVGIYPSYEQLELFVRQGGASTFSAFLDQFAHLAGLDNAFFLCDYANIRAVAELIEPLPLNLRDRYTFCVSPADSNSYMSLFYLFKYASSYANPAIDVVKLGISVVLAPPENSPFGDREMLKQLENMYPRFEKFTERDRASEMKEELHKLITDTLLRMSQEEEGHDTTKGEDVLDVLFSPSAGRRKPTSAQATELIDSAFNGLFNRVGK